jgi:REP element-mobilizing transposase RayT
VPYAPRFVPVDVPSHVRTRATGREPLFRDHEDYVAMEWRLARVVLEHGLGCLSYCLMPNHVHLVLQPQHENVDVAMRNLLSAYARRFNLRWGRRGHLVERRYRSTPAADEPHFFRMLRYVALNPVEADLVPRPELWPYSSYAATIGLREPPIWVDVNRVLAHFDPNRRRAQRLFRQFVEHGLQTRPVL